VTQKTFSAGVELRRLFALAAPLIIAQMSQTAMGVVDTIMAGHYNANDLAAVAVGFSIWLPAMLFIMGLMMGNTALVARAVGAHDFDALTRNIWAALLVSLLVSLPIATGLWFADHILLRMGVASDIASISRDYMRAIAIGLPAAGIYYALRSLTEGMGRTRPIMVIGFTAFILHIPLNYVLIHGLFGLPELGGVGCGVSTAVLMWFSAGALGIVATTRKPMVTLQWITHVRVPLLRDIGSVFHIGLPVAAATFAEMSLFALVAIMLAPFGAVTVGGHQIALNSTSVTFMLPLSLAMASTIRIGNELGAGNYVLAQKLTQLTFVCATAIALFNFTLIFTCAEVITRLYSNDDQVRKVAAHLLLLAAIYQLPDALQVCANGVLRARKDTLIPMLLVLIAYWCVGLPLGYWLGEGGAGNIAYGATGYWWGLVAGLTAAALMLIARVVLSGHRRH
jgi:multidrug resistance protein, MATE family